MSDSKQNVQATGFSEWLFRQQNDDTPIGDLARDALRVPDWPDQASEFEGFDRHLRVHNASYEARKTLREAWEAYTGDPPPMEDGDEEYWDE